MVILNSYKSVNLLSRVLSFKLIPLLGVGLCLLVPSDIQAQSGPPTNNLQLWLKADVGVIATNDEVTAWVDQSGNTNAATVPAGYGTTPPIFVASDPDVNGEPIVQFNTNEFLQLTNALDLTNDTSGFIVLRLHNGSTVGDYRGILDQGCDGEYPNPSQVYIYDVNPPKLSIQRGECSPTKDYSFATSSAFALGQYMELAYVCSNNYVYFYLDNSLIGESSGFGASVSGSGIPMRIGGRWPASGSVPWGWLDGDMAEIMLYDTALSDADRTNAWTYLATKYNLYPATCSLTSPTNGSTFVAPATINLSAAINAPTTNSATGAASSASAVSFLANGVTLVTVTAPPYECSISVATPGTVTLQAVVGDELGASTASSLTTVTVTGSAPVLTPGTNLVLWLRADAGVSTDSSGDVTNWADQSSYGNHAIPGAQGNPPVLLPNAVNGEPAIQFDGTNGEYMQVANSSSLEITNDIACLVVLQQPLDGDYRMVWFQGDSYATPNALMIAANDPLPNRGNGPVGQQQDLYYGTDNLVPNQYNLIAFSQAGTVMSQFLNGVPNGTQSSTVQPAGDSSSPLYIGARGDFYQLFTSDMQIAEIMIFNTSLSGTNLSNVEDYLATKYGVTFVALAQEPGPSVSILSPTDSSTLNAPANFVVTVAATPSTNTSIATVELFANGLPLGTLSAPPYKWPVYVSTPGAVTLTAMATDSHGVAKSSTTTTITLTNTSTPTYTAGTNLVLWFRADAGVRTDSSGNVSNWADQSSYGNDAIPGAQGSPPVLMTNAVNGKPAIQIYGTDSEYLQVANSPSLEITNDIACLVVVQQPSDSDSSYQWIWYQGGTCGTPSPNALALYYGKPAPNRGTGCAGGTQWIDYGTTSLASLPNPDAYDLVAFTQSGTNESQYLNGIFNGTHSSTIQAYDGDTNSMLYIGNRADNYDFTTSEMSIAELLIYNTSLSGTNLDDVQQYLGAKYGLPPWPVSGQLPTLSISLQGANSAAISWPQSYSGYTLQSAPSLSSTNWGAVSGVVNNLVTVTPLLTQQFYRLVSP
jgi:hypothetical protein